MQYMLLCCIDENHWESLGKEERDGVMDDYGAWIRRLEESGRHVASARLQPVANAATLRRKGGKSVSSTVRSRRPRNRSAAFT